MKDARHPHPEGSQAEYAKLNDSPLGGSFPGALPNRASSSAEIYLQSETLGAFMRRRSVNRPFTKPGAMRRITSPSSFEQIVKELNISHGEYRRSLELKEWVRRNKDDKYVPTEVLKVFGFQVESDS